MFVAALVCGRVANNATTMLATACQSGDLFHGLTFHTYAQAGHPSSEERERVMLLHWRMARRRRTSILRLTASEHCSSLWGWF